MSSLFDEFKDMTRQEWLDKKVVERGSRPKVSARKMYLKGGNREETGLCNTGHRPAY